MHKTFPLYLPSILVYNTPDKLREELNELLNFLLPLKAKGEINYLFYFTQPTYAQIVCRFSSSTKEKEILKLIEKKFEPTVYKPFDHIQLFFEAKSGCKFEMFRRHLNECGGIATIDYCERTLGCFSEIYHENQKRGVVELSDWLPYLFYLYTSFANEFHIKPSDLCLIFEELKEEVRPKEYEHVFLNEDEKCLFRQRRLEVENTIEKINIENTDVFSELFSAMTSNIEEFELDVTWQKNWLLNLSKNISAWYKAIEMGEAKPPSYMNSIGDSKKISFIFLRYVIRAWSNQMFLLVDEELFLYDFYSRAFNDKN